MLARTFGSRSWRPGGTFEENGSARLDDFTAEWLERLHSELNVGAVWFTGLPSHATGTSFDTVEGHFEADDPNLVKGEAGSPYAVRDWYSIDPALLDPSRPWEGQFDSLVRRTHAAGMKLFIDFVPNHVARNYRSQVDPLTEENFYNDPDGPRHDGDWYDTAKLNYGNFSTWEKMANVLLFWASKGVDGFRCDMVELVPAEFFDWAFKRVRERYPQMLFIAEVYGKENYRRYCDAGFDLLYGKSDFYDALKEIALYRRDACAFSAEWQFLQELQPSMLNFLENHDEQRVASDFYLGDGLRGLASAAVSMLFNTASIMLYAGQEYGERGMLSEGFSGIDGRSSIFDFCTVPSVARALSGESTAEEREIYGRYSELLATACTALFSQGGTYDLMYANMENGRMDPRRQIAFLRGNDNELALVIANFGPDAEIAVNIPEEAWNFFGKKPRTMEAAKVNSYDYKIIKLY